MGCAKEKGANGYGMHFSLRLQKWKCYFQDGLQAEQIVVREGEEEEMRVDGGGVIGSSCLDLLSMKCPLDF